MLTIGSAGTAVVTSHEALLFADGRYHNQAEMELGSSWTLMRQGEKGRQRNPETEKKKSEIHSKRKKERKKEREGDKDNL